MVVLDGAQGTYRLPVSADASELVDAWFALALLDKKTADGAAKDDRCPACHTDNSIRFLGTAQAALASATVTQLFTGATSRSFPKSARRCSSTTPRRTRRTGPTTWPRPFSSIGCSRAA
ncbi:hypothetical protein [Streptomyces sp. NPDC048272]|uniref:hypothetical protein n=1 Tax=Streptomyces sp. NPDC048272 TaxID=3154616 RepID=UPI003418E581